MADPSLVHIFTGRRVVAMAEEPVPAFASLGEWIVATGSVEELRRAFPSAPVHDFAEGVLVPGFNDAHQHPTAVADDMLDVDLSPETVGSVPELLSALRARASTTPSGEWVVGRRYDHTKTGGRTGLTRDSLDTALEEHPAVVHQIAGHWAVLNSLALRIAGINEESTPPPGGDYGRDATGRLNGVLYERAMDVISPFGRETPIIPPHGLEERLRSLVRYQDMLLAAGITSVGDAFVTPSGAELLFEADARSELNVRVNMMIGYPYFEGMRDLGWRTSFGGSRLRLGGVKSFIDGAIAGGTCLLEEPFESGSDGHPVQAMSDAEVKDFVRVVHEAGSRACMHANGDRAIRLALDAIEEAQRAVPRSDPRHRIEHCTVVDDDIVSRMRDLSVVAVPFGSYIAYHGEKLPGYYGKSRLERMFAHRSLLDGGVAVAGSSDYPCAPFEVLYALQSCVSRRSADGESLGPSQRISGVEALALYTTGSAYAAGEDAIKGRLQRGMLADFVVLDEDPTDPSVADLSKIAVLETWVGGRQVWRQ